MNPHRKIHLTQCRRARNTGRVFLSTPRCLRVGPGAGLMKPAQPTVPGNPRVCRYAATFVVLTCGLSSMRAPAWPMRACSAAARVALIALIATERSEPRECANRARGPSPEWVKQTIYRPYRHPKIVGTSGTHSIRPTMARNAIEAGIGTFGVLGVPVQVSALARHARPGDASAGKVRLLITGTG